MLVTFPQLSLNPWPCQVALQGWAQSEMGLQIDCWNAPVWMTVPEFKVKVILVKYTDICMFIHTYIYIHCYIAPIHIAIDIYIQAYLCVNKLEIIFAILACCSWYDTNYIGAADIRNSMVLSSLNRNSHAKINNSIHVCVPITRSGIPMMTLLHGNIFYITVNLWEESVDHQGVPLKKGQ